MLHIWSNVQFAKCTLHHNSRCIVVRRLIVIIYCPPLGRTVSGVRVSSSLQIIPCLFGQLGSNYIFSSSNREMFFKRQLLPSGLIPMYFVIGMTVTVTSLTSCTNRLAELRIIKCFTSTFIAIFHNPSHAGMHIEI